MTRDRSVYRLISADSHVTEPPDLWTSRLPAKLRDRAPRIERFERGDAWVLEGVDQPIPFGYTACAGLPRETIPGGWMRFEDMRRGGYDPATRLEEMDIDGVDAEVLYPTPRLIQGAIASPDAEFRLALIQAYNDWLSEYVAHAPARFGGIAVLPNCGEAAAVAELERVMGRPGIRGVMIGAYPNGTVEIAPEDDAVWEALEASGLILNIHVDLSTTLPSPARSPLPAANIGATVPARLMQFIFSGVFDRFPRFDVMFAEVECGWIPFFKEQITDNYHRLAPGESFGIERRPIEYIEQHMYITYISDHFGVANRHAVGVDRMLWSSDYPHTRSDWPTSWRSINAAMTNVAGEERHAILAGTAMRLYGFGQT